MLSSLRQSATYAPPLGSYDPYHIIFTATWNKAQATLTKLLEQGYYCLYSMHNAHDTEIEGNGLHKVWQIHADSTIRSKQQ